MSLGNLVSHAGLSIYAQIALVVFFVAFLAIVVRLFWPSRRERIEKNARIPFDDGSQQTPRPGGSA